MFDGSCFDDWKIKMRAVFGFQDVAEVIEVGVVDPGSKASDEEKRNYKHMQKMDSKARYLLYQCVNSMRSLTKFQWLKRLKKYGRFSSRLTEIVTSTSE